MATSTYSEMIEHLNKYDITVDGLSYTSENAFKLMGTKNLSWIMYHPYFTQWSVSLGNEKEMKGILKL